MVKLQKIIRALFWILVGSLIFFVLYTIHCFFAVPDLCELKTKNPKTTAFMEERKDSWEDKNERKRIRRVWVSLSEISPHLKNAVIVTEDPNFYHHHGVDFYAVWMAAREDWERREIVSGASTITQQLMKNLYLSSSRNPLRKWKEVILALRVEKCLKKNRILELYLNLIEWGESTYGAEAAARRYFGKSAAALSPSEAALLTAMIPNPIYYNPSVRNPKLWKNKNLTLRLMLHAGYLSRGEYEVAINQPIHLR